MRYFLLMIKRFLRLCPACAAVALLMLGAVGGMGAALTRQGLREDRVVLKVGVVGDMQQSYLHAGLLALEHLDDSRFYVDLLPMEETDARRRLREGELTGYLLIPEDFVEGILERRSVPLRFVVRGGPVGVETLLLAEACGVASTLVEESQRGIYGMQNYAREAAGVSESLWDEVEAIVLQYVDGVLGRSGVARVRPTAAPDGVSTAGYALCSLLTLGVLLWGLSCQRILRLPDEGLEKMLSCARGGGTGRLLCEYAVYVLFSALLFLPLCLLAPLLLSGESVDALRLCLSFLPGLLSLSALSFALAQGMDSTVGALLGQWILTLGLGFVSGCFYPLWFFPPAWQSLSLWLPTGAAMACLRQGLSHTDGTASLGICLGWWLVFLAFAALARRRKVIGER